MAQKSSVLITGCSDGGIGSALAVSFQQRGFHVFATSRKVESMSKLKDIDNVTLLPLDVEKQDQIHAAVEAVSKETGGKLTFLVNNAGVSRWMPLMDEDIEEAKKVYDTNVWGPLKLTRAFFPLLRAAQGTVAFVSSLAAHMNIPWQGTYCASKTSIEMLSDVLRLELAPFNVRSVTIVTGAVRSQVHTHAGEFKLPEDSIYKSAEARFEARARGEDGAERMETKKYADGVVAKLVGSSTTRFWYGGNAGVVKFCEAWLPTFLLDKAAALGTGIEDMLRQKPKSD